MEYYASLCRLCETTTTHDEKWTVLCSPENKQLLMKLRSCANVEICEDDKLPKRICGRCQRSLDQAYNFKLQCEATNAKLRHEIAFLEKNNWNNGLTIPQLNNEACAASVKDETPAQLDQSSVFVKVEPEALPEESRYDLFFAGSDEPEIELPIPPQQIKVDYAEKNGEDSHEGQPTDKSDSDSGSEFEVKIKKHINNRRGNTRKKNEDGTVKTFSCQVCNEAFRSERKMVFHAVEVHGKTPYDCQVCGKNVSVKSHWKNHETHHSGVRQFECTQCNGKYANERALKSHINYQHNENQPHVCDQCGMKFSQISKLRSHYVIHIEEANFICEVCSKGFKTKGNLKLHMNVHLPKDQKRRKKVSKKCQSSAVCPHCGKVMATAALQLHIRTHTGEQPFQCEVCLKRFASMQLLKKHSLIHTGEKPFVCEFCQKAFRQRHHMLTHIKGVHPNLKPYQCPMCPEAYATPESLAFHERKAHPKPDEAVNKTAAEVPKTSAMD